MKAVIIGTDYIKTSTGEYKVLEINTNTGLGILGDRDETILEWNTFKSFIQSNGFTTVNVIYPSQDNGIRDKIKTICETEIGGITFNSYETQGGSITIPYIEDNEESLTIRLSYDVTAIIDSEYCADNYNFVRALGNSSVKPKSYIPGIVDDFVSLTEFNYSENEPNFIIKKRRPNYDKYAFPKLFKITSLEELNTLKGQVDSENEFLQEFILSELIDNKHSIIRSVDMLYGGNLDVLSLGGYKIGHMVEHDIWPTTYTNSPQIDKKDRPKYITYTYNSEDRINYIVDLDEEIVMVDGTIKIFEDIVVGDQVKSIAIPNLADDEGIVDLSTWSTSFENFSDNFYVTASIVTDKLASEEISDLFIRITFDDDTQWDDLESSHILIKDGDNVKFKSANDFVIGDVVECIETVNYTLLHKTITNLEIVFKEDIRLGEIDVEIKDVFLPLVANNLAVIQHNACNIICSNSRGKWPNCTSYVQCTNCNPAQCAAK